MQLRRNMAGIFMIYIEWFGMNEFFNSEKTWFEYIQVSSYYFHPTQLDSEFLDCF